MCNQLQWAESVPSLLLPMHIREAALSAMQLIQGRKEINLVPEGRKQFALKDPDKTFSRP